MKIYTAPKYTEAQLIALDESAIHFPFSDDDAEYDGFTHQYILTAKYFSQRGIDLATQLEGNSPTKVRDFLKGLSTKVYVFIYSHNLSTRNQMNYLIAVRGLNGYDRYEYRQAFLDAMFLEGEYLLANGDISFTTGVDLDSMQNMSDDVMRNQERDYHKDFVKIMRNLGLSYYGKYRFMVQGEDW